MPLPIVLGGRFDPRPLYAGWSAAFVMPKARTLRATHNNPSNLRPANHISTTTENRDYNLGFHVGKRFQPEPAGPRSRRATTKLPGPSMMSTDSGVIRSGTMRSSATPSRRARLQWCLSWETNGIRQAPQPNWLIFCQSVPVLFWSSWSADAQG